MPPTQTHTKPPSANPERPEDQAPDGDPSNLKTKAADQPEAPGLYVIVATPREGAQLVELHTAETAEARVSLLTYGSRQHRRQAEDDGVDIPDGGGTHEINRKDVQVYKLSASLTDF